MQRACAHESSRAPNRNAKPRTSVGYFQAIRSFWSAGLWLSLATGFRRIGESESRPRFGIKHRRNLCDSFYLLVLPHFSACADFYSRQDKAREDKTGSQIRNHRPDSRDLLPKKDGEKKFRRPPRRHHAVAQASATKIRNLKTLVSSLIKNVEFYKYFHC